MALDVPNLVAALTALHASAGTANEASDAVTGHIKVLEQAVNSLHIGVEVRQELPPTRAGAPIWLGYGRLGDGGWGFLVWEDETCWPWTRAPRWLRLRTLSAFPRLLDRLRQATDDLTAELTQAVATAQEMAAAVQKAGTA